MSNNSIKANELRIGNLLLDRGDKVLRLDYWDFMKPAQRMFVEGSEVHPLTEDLEYCEPIILTDEWFEKWGFYKDGEYWSKGIFDYKYCFKYRDWANNWAFYQEYTDSPNSKDDGIKYPISFDIQYVHQLQNLWYSLLHEEIEP
jgi:hypothetical protein